MTVRSGKNAGVAGAIVRDKECQEMDRLACMTIFVAVVERGGFAPPVHRGLQSLVESATTARTHECPGAARSSPPTRDAWKGGYRDVIQSDRDHRRRSASRRR